MPSVTSNLRQENGWTVVHLPTSRVRDVDNYVGGMRANCCCIASEQVVLGEQGEGHSKRAVEDGSGAERRGPMPISHVQGADETVQQIREALLDAMDAAEQGLGSRYMATVRKRLEK